MRTKVLLLAAVVMAAPVCAGAAAPVRWIFDLSGEGGFFALPFPTELRREPKGGLDMKDFPNPHGLALVERAKHEVARGYGYTTGPAIYFQFDGSLDTDRLPGSKDVMGRRGPVFLINIDRASPNFGRRLPVMVQFTEKEPGWLVDSDRLLAVLPVPGFVLRENTLYAAGVRRSLRGADGARLARSGALLQMAEGKAPAGALGEKALAVYRPALKTLEELDVPAATLAALTVFRTGDPTARMRKLFDGATAGPPLEAAEPLNQTREHDGYYVLEGAVRMPIFQRGTFPYLLGEGGDIVFEGGKPVVQRYEPVPFCVTVPKRPMPSAGFPLLIYIHGTSGISTQVLDRGPVGRRHEAPPPGTGPAMVLARRGIAAAGAAQLENAERGRGNKRLFYHNVVNPKAYRDNTLQSAVEQALLLRFLTSLRLDAQRFPETRAHGGMVRYDSELVFGMGQSLGSETLGPWAGIETGLTAVIHSGHGAYKALQIAEGNHFGSSALKKRGLGTGEGLFHLDRYHPLLNLLAAVFAPADTFVFEPHYYKRPLPGRPAKHLWVSFGADDHYYPISAQLAAMTGMGLDLAGPAVIPGTRELLERTDLRQVAYPVRLNRTSPTGPVTAVTVQYEPLPPFDGHHINFQRHETRYQYGCFLRTLAKTGAPAVFEPRDRWNALCGSR